MFMMMQQMQQNNMESTPEPTATPLPTEAPQPGAPAGNDELLLQMFLMLQQMQQGSADNALEPTATPLPTAAPQPEASFSNDEMLMQMYLMLQQMQQENTGNVPADSFLPGSEQVSVYKNKKLIVESLPAYMFVQKQKPDKNPSTEEDTSTPAEDPKKDPHRPHEWNSPICGDGDPAMWFCWKPDDCYWTCE